MINSHNQEMNTVTEFMIQANGTLINPVTMCNKLKSFGYDTLVSYYKSSSVCLSVCLFVPLLLRGPLTDLRQTCWVYVGGPRNCP